MKTINKRITEFDFLKGICILFVVTSHSLFLKTIDNSVIKFYLTFFSNMAVPIFIIISTFMNANSYYRNNDNFKISTYYPKRILAIILPYTISYILEILILTILNRDLPVYLFGRLGLGSYYILIQLQLIILIPIYLYLCREKIYFFPLFLISLCFEIFVNAFDISLDIYCLIILRYNIMILMGLLLFDKFSNLLNKKWLLFFCFMSMFSVVYLAKTIYLGYIPKIYKNMIETSSCTSLLAMFYIIVVMKLHKNKKSVVKNKIRLIGRSSYFIFLTQMIYYNHRFTFFCTNQFMATLIDTFICIIVGIVFHRDYEFLKNCCLKKLYSNCN